MNTKDLMELASAAPLPAPKEKHWTRELMELRQAWAWALPSVKIHVRYWAARTDSPFWVGEMREESKRCRRLLEIVEKMKAVDLWPNLDGSWTARIFGVTFSGTREACIIWLQMNGEEP